MAATHPKRVGTDTK